MPNEVDKFFEGLGGDNAQPRNIFDENAQKPAEQPPAPENGDENKGGNEGEGGNDIRKNRRHRRLEEQLERERASNIALNERIKVLAEVSRSDPSNTEMPSEWVALMGDSPEAQKAWQLQSKLLQTATAKAKEEALNEFRAEQQRVVQEQKQFESFIDTELETLEDEHNIDLTSNSPAARKARKEFLELVQSLSPKDENGAITAYVDFDSTFKLYQESKKSNKPDPIVEKQKEIASKTIQRPSSSTPAQQPVTPGFRGWQKDYNING